MSAATRFDWDAMRRYWQHHHALRAETDLGKDPHGLGNVCSPGAPPWLNKHFAGGQELIFDALLDDVLGQPGHALDVGCGAGRWTERLLARGWTVDGIDLQASLIDHSRFRLPQAHFECIALQDYEPGHRYSLVCSVTVLGHIPHGEQERAINQIARITTDHASVLVLENIRDQSPHVFANSIRGWVDRFARAGFALRTIRRYDFNPALRSLWGIRDVLNRMRHRRIPVALPPPDQYMIPMSGALARHAAARHLYSIAERTAGALDAKVEPLLIRHHPSYAPSVHAGILFVKTWNT